MLGGAFSYLVGGGVAKAVKRLSDEFPQIRDSGEGEGFKLGGLWVLGNAETPTGILFEHKETHWGDHADLELVRAAVAQIGLKRGGGGG